MILWEESDGKSKYGPGYDKAEDRTRAKKRTLHLLERSPKSEHQIREKLEEGGYLPEVINEAVDYAKSFGYINDERFAKDYVRVYSEKKSRARLSSDLVKKGVDKEIIQAALEEEYQVDEISLIRELLRKRGYYELDRSDYERFRKGKEKQFRFLASRGYSSYSIFRAMEVEDEF